MANVTTPSGAVVDSVTGALVSGPTNTGGPALVPDTKVASATGSSQQNTQSDFMTQLQNTLLQQSGIVSSQNSALEQKMQDAISGVKSANDSQTQALNLSYGAQEQQAQQQGQNQVTSFQEAQRGFATNNAALKQLNDATTKQVNDLETQKQSLILQGNAQAAQQISALQVQAIQFQQQAQQQTFANLLSIGNYAQGVQTAQNQSAQFQQTLDFNNQQAISNVALKYGLTVNPGDTLQSITTRAMPLASQEEKLQLSQIQSQIAANNAQTQASLAAANSGSNLTSTQIDALASAVNSGGAAVLAGIKDPTMQATIINRASDLKWNSQATQAAQAGTSQSDYNNSILNNGALSPTDKSAALKASGTAYAANPTPTASKSSTFPQIAGSAYGSYSSGVIGSLNWLFGVNNNN